MLQANRASCESLYLIYATQDGVFPDHFHPGTEWAYMLSGSMQLSEPQATFGAHDFVWVKSGAKHVNTKVVAGTSMLVFNQSGINWVDEQGALQLFTIDMMLKKYYAYFKQHKMDLKLLDELVLS